MLTRPLSSSLDYRWETDADARRSPQVLEKGVNLKYLYVDTVGDPDRYRQKLESIFPSLIITVEKKADSKFPIVSAASICAKVTLREIRGPCAERPC